MASASEEARPPAVVEPWRDRLAAGLMLLAALGALAAAIGAVGAVSDAGPTTRIVEAWRLYGFVLFAGLFVLLALWPRQERGVWELAIFHKLALTITALWWLSGDTEDADTVIVSDGTLTVLLVAAYVLTRGWTAWRPAGRVRLRRQAP